MSVSSVQFLNHASLVIDSGKTKILCDPWFVGTAFADGWSLLVDQSHDINSIDCDYIWISHEHPDHFSIPTLRTLQSSKTFLYQSTLDKKVKSYLESKGHKVVELVDQCPTKVGDIMITSFVCDGYDSSILVEMPTGEIILNINDARVDIGDHLVNDILPCIDGRPIDLVLFQFGYANWAGNKGDFDIALEQQTLVDSKNLYVIEHTRPTAVLGFASFVYFSHEENFYWNDYCWLDYISKLYEKSPAIFILPGINQKIELADISSFDFASSNAEALAFWKARHDNIKITHRTKTIDLLRLEAEYSNFMTRLHDENPALDIPSLASFKLSIYLKDQECTVTLGLFEKFFSIVRGECSPVSAYVSSETLQFLLKNKFGRGTVTINSRISFDKDQAHRFFIYFFVPYANNIGRYFSDKNPLKISDIMSIKGTSVMTSLLKNNDALDANLEKDLAAIEKALQIG